MIAAKFQRLHPCFRGSSNTERQLGMMSYVWSCCKLKMVAINWKYMVVLTLLLPVTGRRLWLTTYTYIGSQYLYVLLRYTVCPIYFRLMAAIFGSQYAQTRMQDCIPSSISVLPDPRNIGVAVGISLLSCIRAEIYLISYLLPVNGCRLWFMTNPYIGQYSQ